MIDVAPKLENEVKPKVAVIMGEMASTLRNADPLKINRHGFARSYCGNTSSRFFQIFTQLIFIDKKSGHFNLDNFIIFTNYD